jgi:hypothetical protein
MAFYFTNISILSCSMHVFPSLYRFLSSYFKLFGLNRFLEQNMFLETFYDKLSKLPWNFHLLVFLYVQNHYMISFYHSFIFIWILSDLLNIQIYVLKSNHLFNIALNNRKHFDIESIFLEVHFNYLLHLFFGIFCIF